MYELEIGNFGICAYRMVDCELLMIDLHVYTPLVANVEHYLGKFMVKPPKQRDTLKHLGLISCVKHS